MPLVAALVDRCVVKRKEMKDFAGSGLCSLTHLALKPPFNRITGENKEGQDSLSPDQDKDDNDDEYWKAEVEGIRVSSGIKGLNRS